MHECQEIWSANINQKVDRFLIYEKDLIFQNNKSLENQVTQIGAFINSTGGSKEFSNMFRTLVDYYSKYQNSFVKHNDAVIEEEVEFIFEMTSSFMKHLVKMKIKM